MANLKKKIARFLSGKYSNEGKAMYDAWYQSFDDNADYAQENPSNNQIQNELERIKGHNNHNIRSLSPSRSNMVYWRIAASFLILAIASAALYLQWGNIINAIDPITYTELITHKGERMQVTLSDGSEVWLNAGTKLRYPEKFKRGPREVYMEGEAYFEVTRDVKHPFIVHSGKITTTVLGTSFNIQAYENEDLEIAVLTGKVAVGKESDRPIAESLVLLPHQKAVLSKNSQELTMHEFQHAEKYLAWKDGRLIADNLSVISILQMLNRTYDATIEVENDALGGCRVTAEFESMPLERVLDFLCAILNTTYSQKDGKYVIHGSRCQK